METVDDTQIFKQQLKQLLFGRGYHLRYLLATEKEIRELCKRHGLSCPLDA
jgi:hypothetical protein